jgi:hypothetical protein
MPEIGDETKSADLLLEYSRFANNSKPIPGQLRGGRLAPHVQFANANTHEELIEFVKKYGPVNGNLKAPGPLAKDRTAIEVVESLARLRREQTIFASVLKLVGFLKEGSDLETARTLGDLALACSQQAPPGNQNLEEEYLWQLLIRAKHDGLKDNVNALEGFLRNLRAGSAKEFGWYALCVLLSNFPPVIVPVKDGLIEMPPQNNAGILPALVFMLRRDCLLDNEIRLCGQRDCGKFFKVERGGQMFCSTECSRLQRQREYWATKGKEARGRRMARKRNKKGGKHVTV